MVHLATLQVVLSLPLFIPCTSKALPRSSPLLPFSKSSLPTSLINLCVGVILQNSK